MKASNQPASRFALIFFAEPGESRATECSLVDLEFSCRMFQYEYLTFRLGVTDVRTYQATFTPWARSPVGGTLHPRPRETTSSAILLIPG